MHRVLMRNRDLLEGMRRDLDVWIKFPERPPGIIFFNASIIYSCTVFINYTYFIIKI